MATIKANISFEDDVLTIIPPTKESCYFLRIAQNAKKRKDVYVRAEKKETSAQVLVPQMKSCNEKLQPVGVRVFRKRVYSDEIRSTLNILLKT